MLRVCWRLSVGLSLSAVALAARGTDPAADAEFFELKIRPILATVCAKCHGAEKAGGGLRVDSLSAIIVGGDRGPALVPGNPDASLLLSAIRRETDDLKMPPDEPLPAEAVADFAAWIAGGAVWPETPATAEAFAAHRHWAFEPVRPIEPPAEAAGGGESHPIDRFIAERRVAHGLSPLGLAEKPALIRRATFDLIGLPPTPEDVAAFLADDSADALAHVVDRLLASPHYGERWGRHWMDVVRYADTAGDNADYPIPEVHLYRDYIIDSFNADKPYDQFVQEQLAGDLLARDGPAEKHAERTIATGFLALSRRYATAPFELWHLTLEDTIDTTGRAFLGLTLRCARCHDHKFDPVTTEDYYALYGIFASTQFPYAGSEEFASKSHGRTGFMPLVPAEAAQPSLAAHREAAVRIEAEIQQVQATAGADQETRLAALRQQLRDLTRRGLPTDLSGAYAVSDGSPTDTAVQGRGDPYQPGKVVARGVPKFLAGGEPFAIASGSGRLELAR